MSEYAQRFADLSVLSHITDQDLKDIMSCSVIACLCGMKFTPEQTFVVGGTLNIQWKAEAEFLVEPLCVPKTLSGLVT